MKRLGRWAAKTHFPAHLQRYAVSPTDYSTVPETRPGTTGLAWRLKRSLVAGAALSSFALVAAGAESGNSSIVALSANPSTIQAGHTTRIAWQVNDALDVSLSGVTATPESSIIVAPAHTTTYTLRVLNHRGMSVTRSVTVKVLEGSPVASAEIDPRHPGAAIPAGFIGFSHEWGQAQLLMGNPAIGINPIYRQLLVNLSAYGGGPLSIRIGGNSADTSGEPTATTVAPFARLYRDLAARGVPTSFVLDVNLNQGATKLQLPADQAKAFVSGMPSGSLTAIEIGNEPDFFAGVTKYRQPTYPFSQYLSEFDNVARAILTAVPASPVFMGPSDAAFPGTPLYGSPASMPPTTFVTPAELQTFLQQPTAPIGIVSQHSYSGVSANCGGTAHSGQLLEPHSSEDNPALVAPYIAVAQAANKPLRIAEMNSLGCSGQAGISDAFEEALWAPDIMFGFAKVGAVGVNFHTNNWNSFNQYDAYAAFLFDVPLSQEQASNVGAPPPGTTNTPDYQLKAVQSLYYGMLFFAEATPHQARLLPVTLTTSANVKAWATLDPSNGDVNVAIINKETAASGTVQLTVPGYRWGTVKRMLAPSFSATSGITLAGQTFDGSLDGRPRGTEYAEINKSRNGRFEVAVGPTSAFLLTLHRRPDGRY